MALVLAAVAVAGPVRAEPSGQPRGAVNVSLGAAGTREVEFGVNAPPGRLVDVGTHRLHLFCLGSGAVTVVLEAGLGGFSLEWLKIQSDLAAETRVCSYDRAGYGWSEAGPPPRTSARIVDELARLLERAGESPPYLLVGHSFGGYTMQLYTKRHPGHVAGLVLVDASHPRQASRLPEPRQPRRGPRRRLLSWPVLPENYPFEARPVALNLMHRPASVRTQRLELASLASSGRQVAQAGALPGVPAAVISRGERAWPAGERGDELEARWRELQAELLPRRAAVRRLSAPFSGHYVHLDQPWLVEEAIRDVLARAGRRAAGPDTLVSE